MPGLRWLPTLLLSVSTFASGACSTRSTGHGEAPPPVDIPDASPANSSPTVEPPPPPVSIEFCGQRWRTASTTEIVCYERGDDRALDLSPLRHLGQLESLELVSGEIEFIVDLELRDLSPLEPLTKLRRLFLGHTTLNDISPLASLTALEELSLHACPVADLSPLASLVGLRELDLSGTLVTDIRPLLQLSKLERLDLTNTEVDDVRPLTQLTSLERLGLSDDGPIDDRQRAELVNANPSLAIHRGRTY